MHGTNCRRRRHHRFLAVFALVPLVANSGPIQAQALPEPNSFSTSTIHGVGGQRLDQTSSTMSACCLGSTCIETVEEDCAGQDGYFLGGTSACAPDACAIGVCCTDEPACLEETDSGAAMNDVMCGLRGGDYVGGARCDGSDPCQRYRIPEGYEIIVVDWSPDYYYRHPKINECGQVVFFRQDETDRGLPDDVFLYDNGSLVEIGNPDVSNRYPDINDAGSVIWSEGGALMLLEDGEVSVLGSSSYLARINNLGHVVWDDITIHFYDGQTVTEIDLPPGGFENVNGINDKDEIVLTRYLSQGREVILYDQTTSFTLPSSATYAQNADINNLTQVVWETEYGIEMWDGGQTVLLTDRGDNPSINNDSDVAHDIRPPFFDQTWRIRLLRHDGQHFQINNEQDSRSQQADINDAGEITWTWNYGGFKRGGVRLMRRKRTGDITLDGVVSLADAVAFIRCWTPVATDGLCACRLADLDHDRDVDATDFDLLMANYSGPVDDCNTNGTSDLEDILFVSSADCNTNGVPDECDIGSGRSEDLDGSGVPDECELCVVLLPGELDCNGNGIRDDCEHDCNANGIPDTCDVTDQSSGDCDGNLVPDECDLAAGGADCDANGVFDPCEPDCNDNGVTDACDITSGPSVDCSGNGVPDECEPDCNNNGVVDTCDISVGTSTDCNGNEVADECEFDCNANNIPDECELADGTDYDCNSNFLLDSCDLADGTADDRNGDGVPDDCERKIYWTYLDSIQRANRDGSTKEILVTDIVRPRGIAIDGLSGKLYWSVYSDSSGVDDGKIQRANLDGSQVEDVLTGLVKPQGIALDLITDKIYWVDRSLYNMQRANLDGSGVEEIRNDLNRPEEILLDLVGGKVYWSQDSGISVLRANLDGSHVESLWDNSSEFNCSINGLAIDHLQDKLYWGCDRGLMWSDLSGAQPEYLFGAPLGFNEVYQVAVDALAYKVYWTADAGLRRANLGHPSLVEDPILTTARDMTFNDSDCNDNGILDAIEIIDRTAADCNDNHVPDDCELDRDCNTNGLQDICDVANGTSDDCNTNGIPDDCEAVADCNSNGVQDICDIANGASLDCNWNDVPDECDSVNGTSVDCNGNGIPDECMQSESDCNDNDIPDQCDIDDGVSTDFNLNGVADECEPCYEDYHCDDGDDCTGDVCTDQDVCVYSVIEPCKEGGVVSALAVAVNGVSVTPSDDITVLAGDQITVDFFIEGWFPETIDSYHVTIDPAGYSSGSSGFLEPITDPDPEAGLFIDVDRSDWLFAGLSSATSYCVMLASLQGWCDGDVLGSDCVTEDLSEPRYVATMILEASADAVGTLSAGPGSGVFRPLLTRCDQALIEPPVTGVPVIIHVDSDCNSNGVFDSLDISAGTSQDNNANSVPDECETLSVIAEGSRYLGVTSQAVVSTPFALEVTSPDLPCFLAYVDAGGVLTDAPTYQPAVNWDTMHLRSGAIAPETTYSVRMKFADGTLGEPSAATTNLWGDAVGIPEDSEWTSPDGAVSILDIVAVLNRFGMRGTLAPLEWVDVDPETPNRTIDISDIVQFVDAFRGVGYPFAWSCP